MIPETIDALHAMTTAKHLQLKLLVWKVGGDF